MPTRRKMAKDIERGLSSAGKLKILRLLMERSDHAFTKYEIGKKVSNDPVSIRNDLETLVQIHWISNFKIQHLDKYAINLENPTVKHLADFLHKVEYIR